MSMLVLLALLLRDVWTGGGPAPGHAYIVPSGPEIPENLLRFEIRFETPPEKPVTVEQLELLDESGKELTHALLDLALPSADGRRVTVLLHPGRVKSGLMANVKFGRALHAGDRVTLRLTRGSVVVSRSWRVTGEDREPPSPTRWDIEPPDQGTREPLVVRLDAPVSSCAEFLIAVRGPDGRRVDGRASLDAGETVWRFTPVEAWAPGPFELVVHPDLEDFAGNRPGASFEMPAGAQERVKLTIPFETHGPERSTAPSRTR